MGSSLSKSIGCSFCCTGSTGFCVSSFTFLFLGLVCGVQGLVGVVGVDVLEHRKQEPAQPSAVQGVAWSVVLDVPEHGIATPVQHATNVARLVVVIEDRLLAALDALTAQPTVPGLGHHHLRTVPRYLRGFELVHMLP